MTHPHPHAGHGSIHVVAQPNGSSIQSLSYQYPLKLVVPSPLRSTDDTSVQTVYLLSYGGGMVAGDSITLSIVLDPVTRLVLLTQGSTKIFKSSSSPDVGAAAAAVQTLSVRVAAGAALAYLPDPVQPFADSNFAQRQIYDVHEAGGLCVLDWVSRGRAARGEDWQLTSYASRNEVWRDGRLLVRDSLVLEDDDDGRTVRERMYNHGIMATLVIYGPIFARLVAFFHAEFTSIPRIGARQWDDGPDVLSDDILWTVASVRDCTVVKFGAQDVQSAKTWLHGMLTREGSVQMSFGDRALLCLS